MCFGHQLPWNVSNHSLADDLPTFFIKDDTQPAIGLADSSPGSQSLLLLLLPITDRLGPPCLADARATIDNPYEACRYCVVITYYGPLLQASCLN